MPLYAHAYVRTADGFVTSMRQPTELFVGEGSDEEIHGVPFINPGRNHNQRSYLRVTNHATRHTTVHFDLWDDSGAGPIRASFVVGAGRTRQIAATEVEEQTGAGQGKWKALATATPAARLTILSILDTPTGHITNLSR